jgi:hypothetical protein
MKEEEADFGDDMMTEAEMTYLTSMEEVKTISHKLVLAETAFGLVRDRIEKLVAKYEALLVKFESADSIAASSIVTASSYYSEYSSSSQEERNVMARRTQRAELRAELAAREAMLGKQEPRMVHQEKEDQLHVLQQRLNDLQSESSAAITEREHSVVLARAITAKSRNGVETEKSRISKSKIDDVKQRFRNRAAGKSNGNPSASYTPSPSRAMDGDTARSNLYRAVGEEMFQHLDFYERSLKAVESVH